MGLWTVDRDFEQPVRHKDLNRSGGSFVAIFTLRLIPDLENQAVSFASRVTDKEAIPWIPYIEKGVRSYQEQRAIEGRPIGFLHVELVSILVHIVDSKGHRFTEAAVMAMTQAFETHGVEF